MKSTNGTTNKTTHDTTSDAARDARRLRTERRQPVRLLVGELHHVTVEPERRDARPLGAVAADEERARGHLRERVQVVHRPPGHEGQRDARGPCEPGEHVDARREDP